MPALVEAPKIYIIRELSIPLECVFFYRIVAIKARRAGGSLLLHRRSQRLGSLLDPPADNPCRSLRIFAAGLMVLAESPNGDLCVATLRIGIWRSVEMTHENSERI
jgi:hypothetical protein